MGYKNDLTGQRFGKLTVIRFNGSCTDRHSMWECVCDCGRLTVVSYNNLKSGGAKSCGCCNYKDLTGMRFGAWTVIRHSEYRNKKHFWICRCDCGTEKERSTGNINSSRSKSCGCAAKKHLTGLRFGGLVVLKEYNDKYHTCECLCDCGVKKKIIMRSILSGRTTSCGCIGRESRIKSLTKHGDCGSSLYGVWSNIRRRCYDNKNKAYSRYGGRGISVCAEWMGDAGFIKFKEWAIKNGYRADLTIDRINNDGNYEPNNCRWATMKIQMNNMSRNRRITGPIGVFTISEWADIIGINQNKLRAELIKYNWDICPILSNHGLYKANY